MILEYASKGDIYEMISKKGKLSETEARFYFRQLIQGIEFAHKNEVSHRDLKLENLLIFEDNNMKIADFGLSSYIKPGEFAKSSRGTARYADPEILKKKLYCPLLADIWACGVILFCFLTGKAPFDDDVLG